MKRKQYTSGDRARLAYLASNGKRVPCRLYDAWLRIRRRCASNLPNFYKWYKGKGIRVCDEWSDFTPFREWALKNGFGKGLEIDRIDSDGNYEPANCRWSTKLEQQNNTSATHHLTIDGVTKTLSNWARERGVDPQVFRMRRSAGWSDTDIVLTPILRNGQVRPGVRRGRQPTDRR